MKTVDWGLTPYTQAANQQLELVEQVLASRDAGDSSAAETLVFCSHPPVVTLGRGTKPGDVFGWRGETLETPRGGRATYHGPSQIVAYPILDLDATSRSARSALRPRDLHAYMRALEVALVSTLQEFGIQSEARTVKADADTPSLTGVWVGEKKIASIGIAVKKWVTYHGIALNVTRDPNAFSGINPCGFRSEIMTSMEDVLVTSKSKVDRTQVQAVLKTILLSHFQ
jgi:lipoyl(octanoyl) transferase